MTIEEKISENINRFLKSFIDEKNPSYFFPRLADYMNYVMETPILEHLISEEMKKRQAECDKEMELEEKAVQELQKSKKKLLKIVRDKSIAPESLQGGWSSISMMGKTVLDDLRDFESGKIRTSQSHSEALEGYLFEITAGIKNQGKGKLIEEFEDPNPSRYITNTYGNFIFSKTLKERYNQTAFIEKIQKSALWGKFDQLIKFQKAFFEASHDTNYLDVLKKYAKENNRQLLNKDAVEITHLAEDIKKVMHSKNQGMLYFLNMENLRDCATRATNYLLTEISRVKETTESSISKVVFKNGILHFQNKKLDFNRKDNQKELLDVLFKEPKKEWFYDEIQGEWDENWNGVKKNNPASKKYWEKFYTAGDKINTAIAIETGIKDFITKNTGTKGKVRINPEYL